MSYGITCTELPLDEADMRAATQIDQAEVARATLMMERLPVDVSRPPKGEGDLWSSVMGQLVAQSLDIHFLDLAFPPTSSSIWSRSPSSLATDLPLSWRRLHSFLPPASSGGDPPSFFLPSVDPNDVAQGRLGNCWFCSALSAVAETPELIARLFGPPGVQQVNERGVYTVRLCITGQWRTIVIDDFFPCYTAGGPIFTRNHGAQLWCLLLEKTFAKVHGGYDRLTSGQAHYALADLTGYPVRSYQLESADTAHLLADGGSLLWAELREWARQDLSTCAGTIGKEHANTEINARLKSVGLIAGHAYSLLDCFEIPLTASTSAGTRLLQLRNPWGQGEWTGDWSDSSPLWTAELVQLLKPTINASVEDGLFYLSFEDFLRHFATVSTCFIRSPRERPWHEVRLTGVFRSTAPAAAASNTSSSSSGSQDGALPGAPSVASDSMHASGALPLSMYALTVTSPSDFWSVIYQPDVRLPDATPWIDQAILVIRMDDGEGGARHLTIVSDTKLESNRQTNAPAHLLPGEYIVLPYTTGTRLPSGTDRSFQVALFSDESSTLDQGGLSVRPLDVALYTDVMCELLRSRGRKTVLGKDSQLWLYELRHGSSHLYGCVVAPSSAKSFSVTLDSAPSRNARSHREVVSATTTVQRVVPPGQLLLFHHLTPVQETTATNYECAIKFKTAKA